MTATAMHRMMMRTILALAALAVFSALHEAALSADTKGDARSSSTLTNESYRPFLINALFNYYGNNGDGSYNRFSADNEGFEFPKGSGLHIVYEDGLLWGGFHKGRTLPKVGGSAYRHALQAGTLLTNGTPSTDPVPADAADPKYRIYSVRPDIRPDVPFSTVESTLNTEEVPYLARYGSVTARGLYDQYVADWNAWPAADGAPYTDVNTNGVYDPAVDIPGQRGADQTLWFVANDMHQSRVNGLAGCPPIGLEVHRTIWGYKREGALGNTIFISNVLINKSGAPVDSMYFAQWADPDLGSPGDDFVGCDTTYGLGYVYNGAATDAVFGSAVPAHGFLLLQGPVVPGAPTDTAGFLSSRRPGFRNLRMSAFACFTRNTVLIADPVQGVNGDLQWYRAMRGTSPGSGLPFTDPNTMTTTPFCVAGDPVRATDGSAGWVDGQGGVVPEDRTYAMVTGPFTLANGDTQQVVMASIASRGADRISSISTLRADTRAVRQAYQNTMRDLHQPLVSCAVSWPDSHAVLAFRMDAHDSPANSVSLELTTFTDSLLCTIPLGDDGSQGDGPAHDGIWGGTVRMPMWPSGLKAAAVITGPGTDTTRWPNVLDHITTARLSVVSFGVASDNLNSNGIVNPGENIRFVFSLRNNAPFALQKLVTRSSPVAGNGMYTIGTLASHAVFSPHYDANDPQSYFVCDVPAGYADTTFRVAIVTTDDSLNVWRDTLVFPVKALPSGAYRTPLAHLSGQASGDYAIAVVDPSRIKSHLYVLRGGGVQAGVGGYTLKDSTTGAILLQDHPVPDTLGHTSPVVDGFKVLRGTTMDNPGMRSWSVPQGSLRFSPVGGYRGVGLEGFSDAADPQAYDPAQGTIGAAAHFAFGGIGSGVTLAECHTILLKLAAVDDQALWDPLAVPSDPNVSRGYRYLRASTAAAAQPSFAPWIVNKAPGYPYQGYDHSIPFSAWDMDITPPLRLAVGHFENNITTGRVDGRYWPGEQTEENRVVREYAFIFAFPYTEFPDPSLMVNLEGNVTTPLMWVMTCSRRAAEPWPGNDQFLIVAHHYPSIMDTWLFNPSVVLGVNPTGTPSSFALLQNYPNPFNPSTTIRYDLPAQSEVTITVYDILGRAVRHLVRDVQPGGHHAVQWGAENDAGIIVTSGVYFYRCTVQRSDRSGHFDRTMKMILLR